MTFVSLSVFAGLFVLSELLEHALSPSRDVVATEVSPAGPMQAVLEEINGGSSTSFGYDIYLELTCGRGDNRVKVAHAYGAYRSEQAYGVTLVWPGPTTLEVQYYQARTVELLQPRVYLGPDLISVRLRGGVSDPNAPAGGMLYDLQGRPPLN